MINLTKAIYTFWSSFGIPAYMEDNVPDDAQLPYITYELTKPDWNMEAPTYARVWYRDATLVQITSKLTEIEQRIGGGVSTPIENGCIALYKGDPFIQFQPYETDSDVKVAYLNLVLQAFTD